MDAPLDFARPDPTPAELVAVAALVEQDVAYLELESLCLLGGDADGGDIRQIEETSLDVRDPEIWNLDEGRIALALRVLRDAADDLGNLPQCRPRPIAFESGLDCACPEAGQLLVSSPERLIGRVETGEVFLDRRHDPPLLGDRGNSDRRRLKSPLGDVNHPGAVCLPPKIVED
jgi:hypothetical protein